MYLDQLSNRSLLLLGKSRALSSEEFAAQLEQHGVTLVTDFNENVALIAEGRMLNPLEQELRDELYARNAAPIVDVLAIEKELCEQIDGDRLLMSLKLGNDQQRLLGFLQNRLIPDALFLRLIRLFEWQGEGFFENDANRDATAALIERFYENIERNHNVQYANMGLMHLLRQTRDAELVETISSLPPLQNALKKGCDNSTEKILLALASHPLSPHAALKQFVRHGDTGLRVAIAERTDIDAALQEQLYACEDDAIDGALASNPAISEALFERLSELDSRRDTLAAHCRLDTTRFHALLERSGTALAANPTLDRGMQEALYARNEKRMNVQLAGNAALDAQLAHALYGIGDGDVHAALAANAATPVELLEKLSADTATHAALAQNVKTPASVLEQLFKKSDFAVMSALAKNPSTPVELLYQLQLDKRLERYVMANEGFGRHIQTDNIGWQL